MIAVELWMVVTDHLVAENVVIGVVAANIPVVVGIDRRMRLWCMIGRVRKGR